jgi:hypothetical protein
MNNYILIIVILFLLYFCTIESFTVCSDCNSEKNIYYNNPPFYNGPLRRDSTDFPNYPLPMPDRYEFGRMFIADAPEISYRPGYW